MTEKHQKASEEQAGQGIGDLARIARVVYSGEEAIRRAKEVGDCRQCEVEQDLRLLLREFGRGDFGILRIDGKKLRDDFVVCSRLSMIRIGHSWRYQLSLNWELTQLLPRLCPECSSHLRQKMESWLFKRSKNRQREKIFHDVFANGCFGSISSAKNFGSSELVTPSDYWCLCGNSDTVGEPSKQRTYAFHSTEYKELTRLRLNSPTVSSSPKAHFLHSRRVILARHRAPLGIRHPIPARPRRLPEVFSQGHSPGRHCLRRQL